MQIMERYSGMNFKVQAYFGFSDSNVADSERNMRLLLYEM